MRTKRNVRKLVINNPDRCFVTPSVVKECVKFSPGRIHKLDIMTLNQKEWNWHGKF